MLDGFYQLLDRDLNVDYFDNFHQNRKVRNLNFFDLADALEILSTLNFNYPRQTEFYEFLAKVSKIMMKNWDNFENSSQELENSFVKICLTSKRMTILNLQNSTINIIFRIK